VAVLSAVVGSATSAIGSGVLAPTDRDRRQHMVDEIRRALRHPPPAATGAEAAPFARERYQAFGVAVAALKPREAAGPASTRHEVAKLLLDERGNAALAMLGRAAEKGREMLAHDAVQNGVLGRPRAVGVHPRGRFGARGHHAERHE
jgi:hypothetical protein